MKTLKNWQYIELVTRADAASTSSYLKVKMFVTMDDARKLSTLLDTADNQANQCSDTTPNGCFSELIKQLDDVFVISE